MAASRRAVFLLGDLAGEEHAALDQHKLACHAQEFNGKFNIKFLRACDVFDILVADERYRNILDLYLVFVYEIQKKVERTFEFFKLIGYSFHGRVSVPVRRIWGSVPRADTSP